MRKAQSRGIALKEYEVAGKTLQISPQSMEVRSSNPDFEEAFRAAAKKRVSALITLRNPLLIDNRKRIAELAIQNRLPSMSEGSVFVEAGVLTSYSSDENDSFRRAAFYVDKILKGAKPGDLPVEQPTKFELVINLKTAKQIGLTIPPNVLARADRVIKSDISLKNKKTCTLFGFTLCAMLFALVSAAEAQQTQKIFRIGYLDLGTASGSAVLMDAFRQKLSKLGWVEGKNINFEYRFAEQKNERLPDLAAELVRLNVDLIVVSGTTAALPAKSATTSIPILMANAADPLGAGLVTSCEARRQCHGVLKFNRLSSAPKG